MDPAEPHERLTSVEIKLAFLEEHVEQQDREIVALRALLDKHEAELTKLRKELDVGGLQVREQDERPPHY